MQLTRNFSLAELTVTQSGLPNVPNAQQLDRIKRLATQLQAMRDDLGVPLRVNSAFRSAAVNKAVGGANASRHLVGDAADIALAGHDLHVLVRAAIRAGFKGIGLGKTFLHVDLRSVPAVWPYTPSATAVWRAAGFGNDPVATVRRMLSSNS